MVGTEEVEEPGEEELEEEEEGVECQEHLHLPLPTLRHRDPCPLCPDQSPTMTSPDQVPAFFPVQFPTMTSELSTSTPPADQGGSMNDIRSKKQ